MQQKIAQFKREAELANQRGEDAERQSKVEASRLSRDATRRVLEAQTESTKAFTEVTSASYVCLQVLLVHLVHLVFLLVLVQIVTETRGYSDLIWLCLMS